MASHPGPLSLEEICEIVNKYFEEIIPRKIQRIVGEQYRYDMIHLLDYLARSPTGDHLAREVYAAFDKECNTTAIFKLGRCLEQVLWLDWGQNTRCAELLFNLRRHDPVVVGYSITWALSRVHARVRRYKMPHRWLNYCDLIREFSSRHFVHQGLFEPRPLLAILVDAFDPKVKFTTEGDLIHGAALCLCGIDKTTVRRIAAADWSINRFAGIDTEYIDRATWTKWKDVFRVMSEDKCIDLPTRRNAQAAAEILDFS
ncbi:hypothetical protein F5B17DRAFT_47826 [Nemania serpens]|nr:hypothetical protein F5B17DRAFT_47826 [Nemania serpens]